MSEDLGITVKKEKNFGEWYLEVVRKGKLIDQRYPVKGCDVFMPRGFSIWETIQKKLDKKFKDAGVKNVYFPLLIPEHLLRLEEKHFEGFSAEVPWVTMGGETELEERLAIRPTSEVPIYVMFSKWLRSHADLPFKINQWCNVMRWETKATKPFLRGREFLWQEGHTMHESKEKADEQVKAALEWYRELMEEELAMPVMIFKRPEHDKFAGAFYTAALDSMMPDGRTLQVGTSHNLGQNFSKPFNIEFLDKENQKQYAWQTSWGVSTRVIGGMVMLHSDDRGLVLPPRVAPLQVVIVPIYRAETEETVIKAATEIFEQLKELKVEIDLRDKSPGFKFADAELKGIPLRVEIGPKEVEKGEVVIVRRDTGEKIKVKNGETGHEIDALLKKMQKDLFSRAKKILSTSIVDAGNWELLVELIGKKKMVRIGWCGQIECAEKLKEKTGAEIRGELFEKEVHKREKCAICEKRSVGVFYAARQY